MPIEYLGLSSINGPLIVLEGVQDAFYDEIVEFIVGGNQKRIGRIIELYEDKAVIQVFEGSEGMSLVNTHTRLTGHPMEIGLSREMLGRTFNGIDSPLMIWGRSCREKARRQWSAAESGEKRVSEKLYPYRDLRHRRTDNADPGTEAPDFLWKRASSRPACGPDRQTGVPWGRFGRRVCHRVCGYGCQA